MKNKKQSFRKATDLVLHTKGVSGTSWLAVIHMKTVLFVTVTFLICINPMLGQTILDEINFHESSYFYLDINTQERLFQRNNIAQNKVRSVYIVQTFGKRDVDGNAQFKDTLYRYDFDSLGHIKIGYQYYDKKYTSLFIDTDDLTLSLSNSIRDTSITIFKISHGDTTHIIRKTFKNGNLIHHIKEPTEKYLKEISCLTGEYIDSKYSYDSLNRLTMESEFIAAFYLTIEYQDFGAIIRTFNSKSKVLMGTERIYINSSATRQQVAGRNIYIDKTVENGLVLYITVLSGTFPHSINYYELEYQY